ncbi:MAG: ATP-binding cassette domain-containing protein, partial [Saprospiraceae bacterium]
MDLFQLLKENTKHPVNMLILLALLSGASNAMLIAVINTAAGAIVDPNEELNQFFFLLYFLFLSIFLYANRYVLDQSCFIIESTIVEIRKRIANKIRLAELSTLETIGISEFYSRTSQDASFISNQGPGLVGTIQVVFKVFFMLFYIGYLSSMALMLVLLGLISGVFFYAKDTYMYAENWRLLGRKETEFFDKLSNLLSGFKEIRINRQKNEEVYASYVEVNEEKLKLKVKTIKLYNANLTLAQISFYAIFGALIFVLPHLYKDYPELLIRIVAAILFILGPIESILNFIPRFANADSAAKNILDLEARMDQVLGQNIFNEPKQYSLPTSQNFPFSAAHNQEADLLPRDYTETLDFDQTLSLENVRYRYPGKPGAYAFTVGPINLTINKGELIFLTGSNGSGKSTFLKILTGLYLLQEGNLHLDRNIHENKAGVPINFDNHEQYRNLYTTIFADFHLFDKIYGLKDIDEQTVKQLLKEVELPEEKTTYKDGAFTNIRLSSGQKKRLALAVSVLENKEIYIYDEVAADLDPWF